MPSQKLVRRRERGGDAGRRLSQRLPRTDVDGRTQRAEYRALRQRIPARPNHLTKAPREERRPGTQDASHRPRDGRGRQAWSPRDIDLDHRKARAIGLRLHLRRPAKTAISQGQGLERLRGDRTKRSEIAHRTPESRTQQSADELSPPPLVRQHGTCIPAPADHELCFPGKDRPDESIHFGRVIRPVAVQKDDDLRAVLLGPGESPGTRRAVPQPFFTKYASTETLGNRSALIVRCVVDDDRLLDPGRHLSQHLRQSGGLVSNGHHDVDADVRGMRFGGRSALLVPMQQTHPPARRRLDLIVWLAGLLIGATYLDLALRSQTAEGATLFDLARTSVLVLLLIGGVLWFGQRSKRRPPLHLVLGFSLLFHLVGVLGEPILEDDWNRYLFDGWVFEHAGTPYDVPPSHFFDSDLVPDDFEPILDGINNPEIPTVYGPTLQWLFRGLHAIAPASLNALQGLIAVFSLVVVGLLARGADTRALLFFAWHPLLIKEFAFSAHSEPVAVAFLLAALALKKRSGGLAGLLLGLAVGAKLFALLIVPAALGRSRSAWLAFGLSLAALYGPFFAGEAAAWTEPASEGPLATMGFGWLFNAPLYLGLQHWTGPLVLRLTLGLAFFAYWLIWTRSALREPEDSNLRGGALFAAMLLVSPVLNPWYVLWPFVFFVRRPSLWLGTASVAVLMSYGTGLNLGDPSLEPYEIPTWILCLEFGAIAFALGLQRFFVPVKEGAGHRSSLSRKRASR